VGDGFRVAAVGLLAGVPAPWRPRQRLDCRVTRDDSTRPTARGERVENVLEHGARQIAALDGERNGMSRCRR
jgi:hypothetical protein